MENWCVVSHKAFRNKPRTKKQGTLKIEEIKDYWEGVLCHLAKWRPERRLFRLKPRQQHLGGQLRAPLIFSPRGRWARWCWREAGAWRGGVAAAWSGPGGEVFLRPDASPTGSNVSLKPWWEDDTRRSAIRPTMHLKKTKQKNKGIPQIGLVTKVT